MKRFPVLLLICATVLFADSTAPLHFDGQSWWGHVKVLAADNMEGRETGSPGLAKAESYVVEQLKRAGLQPAGTKGFYQPIKFVSRQILEKDSSMTLVRDGKEEPLTLGEDAMFSTRVDLAPSVEAPLVFVGYGMRVPEMNYDDFAGVDLKGKIAVIFSGIPKELPGPLASHYQTAAERWKTLRDAGAIGTLTIPNPASMDIPWARMKLSRTKPSMALADPEFDETAGDEIAGTINPASAPKFFAASGHTFDEILALSKDRQKLPAFPLNLTLRAKTKLEKHELESSNIVARLPGSDPSLKDEYVVLSAHVDHVGVGEPINGDRIYNGAMDNASGDAVLLDVAGALAKSKAKPRRSLLFLFVTAEEKGLLGSKYFVAHPTIPEKSIIADINIDMFLPIYPLKSLIVYGINESTLGDDVRKIAQEDNIEAQEDPEPQRNSFIRSDQYNFIRHGIPALAMKVGYKPGTEEDKKFHDWLHQRYHAPSDDLNQPVDLGAAGMYEQVIGQLMMSVADGSGKPSWKENSFFRRYAKSQ